MLSFKDKKWYKSKTFWVAVVATVLGGLGAFGIVVPEFVFPILGALGLYTVRDAIGKSGPDTDQPNFSSKIREVAHATSFCYDIT